MDDAARTINEIGATIRRVMGGTSGILYDNLCFPKDVLIVSRGNR